MTVLSHGTRLASILPLAFALALAAAAGPTPLAAQLPPAIQADRLLLRAEDQIKDESYSEALRTLEQILALQEEHDLEIPDGSWFKHAQVAMLAGSAAKARESVLKYLELAGQEGEHYLEALQLLNETDRRLEEAGRLLRQAESTSPGRVFRDCDQCPVMVEVPAGSFMMGSPESEAGRFDAEGPRHRVTIGSPFAVGVYEVTFAEWEACVAAGGCGGYRPEDEGLGRGSRPVINVRWEDAREYVRWLSWETGEEYRLLTEAEWEYVARAGTQTARYWGESESGQCRYANGDDDDVSCSDGHEQTAPVGLFEPNAFGLYDVLGNVWEWTQDCWNDSYSGAPADGSAWCSGSCSARVLRSGSWGESPRGLRSAYRYWISAGPRLEIVGFRVARTIN